MNIQWDGDNNQQTWMWEKKSWKKKHWKKSEWKVALMNGDVGCCCLIWLLCYSNFLSNELGVMDLFQMFFFCSRFFFFVSIFSIFFQALAGYMCLRALRCTGLYGKRKLKCTSLFVCQFGLYCRTPNHLTIWEDTLLLSRSFIYESALRMRWNVFYFFSFSFFLATTKLQIFRTW